MFFENNFLAKIFPKRLYALSVGYELPTTSPYLDAGEDMEKNTKNQSLLASSIKISIALSYFNLSFIARLYISVFRKYREQKGSFLRFCYFIRNYMQIVIKSIKDEIRILFGTLVNRITFTSFNSGIGVIQHNMKINREII